MASLVQSLQDLIGSIFEVIFSIFRTVYNVIATAIQTVLNMAESLLSMVLDMFKGAIQAAGGVGKFVASNIVIIGVLAAAGFGYLQYQRRQGNTVKVGDKKLN